MKTIDIKAVLKPFWENYLNSKCPRIKEGGELEIKKERWIENYKKYNLPQAPLPECPGFVYKPKFIFLREQTNKECLELIKTGVVSKLLKILIRFWITPLLAGRWGREQMDLCRQHFPYPWTVCFLILKAYKWPKSYSTSPFVTPFTESDRDAWNYSHYFDYNCEKALVAVLYDRTVGIRFSSYKKDTPHELKVKKIIRLLLKRGRDGRYFIDDKKWKS